MVWPPTSQSPFQISDPAVQFPWAFGQGGIGFVKQGGHERSCQNGKEAGKAESQCEAQDEILLLTACRLLTLLGNFPPLGDLSYEISITYSSNPLKKKNSNSDGKSRHQTLTLRALVPKLSSPDAKTSIRTLVGPWSSFY